MVHLAFLAGTASLYGWTLCVISTYRAPHSAASTLLFIDLSLWNLGVLKKVASIEVRRGRGHMRGMAVALGIMLIVAAAMTFLAVGPGMLPFQGSAGGQTVPGMDNLYSMDTMKCALSMNCNLTG